MLEVGTKAPDFELPDQNGVMHKLSDYAGKKVILYFYPKDNTAGCSKQACGFSERYPQFIEKGAEILGVSKDSVASHKRFEEKFNLASKEYSKCIEKYLQPNDRYITITFCEKSGDKLATKGTYAKMARGEMVRYMAENNIEDPIEIQKFNLMEYVFRKDLSSDIEYVFERIHNN